MASTNVDIANKALAKLGSRAITALDQSGSNEATAINNVYTDILDEVLSEHPWTFAQKRLELTETCPNDVSRSIDDVQFPPVTITGATVADPVVITAAAHGFVDDDWVKITSVAGMTELNGNFYIVANATTDTFELTSSDEDTEGDDIDGTAFTAYTSGGELQKAFDMPTLSTQSMVVYDRPSDMIKPTGKNLSDAIIDVELNRILSSQDGLILKYTYRNTTVTQYFSKFIQALSTRLAAEVAFTITHSISTARDMMVLYRDIDLPSALSVDSTQGSPDEMSQNQWLDSRITGSSGVATTGETWHPI